MGGKKKRPHGSGPGGERDRGGSPRSGGDQPTRRARDTGPLPIIPSIDYFRGEPELMRLREPIANLNLQLGRLVCSYVGARDLTQIGEPSHGETAYRQGLWSAIQDSAAQVRQLGITANMHNGRLPVDSMIDSKYWEVVWQTFGREKRTLIEFVGGQLLSILDRFPLDQLPDANLAKFLMTSGGGGLTRVPAIDLRTGEMITDTIYLTGDMNQLNTQLRRYMMLYQQFFAYSFALASMPSRDETWFLAERQI